MLDLSKDNLKIDNIELSANSEKLYGNANIENYQGQNVFGCKTKLRLTKF